MTRDEQRKACIEAMESAYDTTMETHDTGRKADFNWLHKLALTAALDSLHGIARVNPIEATEEMCYIIASVLPKDIKPVWRAMSTKGDLTNPPATKP